MLKLFSPKHDECDFYVSSVVEQRFWHRLAVPVDYEDINTESGAPDTINRYGAGSTSGAQTLLREREIGITMGVDMDYKMEETEVRDGKCVCMRCLSDKIILDIGW